MKVVFIRSPRLAIFPPILYDNVCSAGMAELADALASGASDRKVMQVQVLFPAPNRDRDFLSRSLFCELNFNLNSYHTSERDET